MEPAVVFHGNRIGPSERLLKKIPESLSSSGRTSHRSTLFFHGVAGLLVKHPTQKVNLQQIAPL
jgi:hypothetical protein